MINKLKSREIICVWERNPGNNNKLVTNVKSGYDQAYRRGVVDLKPTINFKDLAFVPPFQSNNLD